MPDTIEKPAEITFLEELWEKDPCCEFKTNGRSCSNKAEWKSITQCKLCGHGTSPLACDPCKVLWNAAFERSGGYLQCKTCDGIFRSHGPQWVKI